MNAMDQFDTALGAAWNSLIAAPKKEFMIAPAMTLLRQDVKHLVQRLAVKFEASGALPGDRVFIRTHDEGCAISCFLTCLMDGLVPVMVSPETPDEKAANIIDIAEAKLAVLDDNTSRLNVSSDVVIIEVTGTAPARKKLSFKKTTAMAVVSEKLGLDDTERQPRLIEDPDGLAYILFTSGTTSDPAGVMISRGALLANVATIANVLEIDGASRIFNDMILSHADGMIQGPVMALLTGCTLVRAGGFAVDRIEDWLNRVRSCRCTHFTTVPTVWALIERYCTHDDYFDAAEFKYLGTVAAAMPQDLWETIEQRFGKPLISQYGLTETVASALYSGKAPGAGAPFTAGMPVDCEARIEPIKGSDEGELMLRGTNIFGGYWKNSERTESTLTADGWLRTGDLAVLRADGSYEIKGRLKTVIMSAGFLIRPEEIDDAMTQHDTVHESVTVALPHPEFGEIAATAVVCAEDGPNEGALRAHVQSKLEALKVPKHIMCVETIPRGDAGKPKLDAVRAMLADTNTGSGDALGGSEIDIEAKLLELAAGVFYMSADDLSLNSKPDTVEGWDSFTHISLILALEEGFAIRIPPHRAAALRSLGDAAIAIREASE